LNEVVLETVLLAIEGETPHRSVMSFAEQFCRRMHVALDILRVVRPAQGSEFHADFCAEDKEGEEKETVPCAGFHLLTSENPPKAIASYIDAHRNIVLAIYDSWVGHRNIHTETRAGDAPAGFEKPLAVPLVVMRG
jgi:hypothetical protein